MCARISNRLCVHECGAISKGQVKHTHKNTTPSKICYFTTSTGCDKVAYIILEVDGRSTAKQQLGHRHFAATRRSKKGRFAALRIKIHKPKSEDRNDACQRGDMHVLHDDYPTSMLSADEAKGAKSLFMHSDNKAIDNERFVTKKVATISVPCSLCRRPCPRGSSRRQWRQVRIRLLRESRSL